MPSEFIPRLTKPGANNKYYITKASGGYSAAIEGSPKDNDCNVLSNCVGYAYGRFNEIGNWGGCKYLSPVNAKDFMKYKGTCDTGFDAKIGSCMVWENGNAGHVAIVEKVISDGEVITSESEWGGRAFYTLTRKKGDGNWGYGGKFLGFIYNPAECCNLTEYDINVGDIIEFIGRKHYLNPSAASGSDCTKGFAKVTKIEKGKKHPYHIVGEYHGSKNKDGSNAWGWVDSKDIKPIKKEENKSNINLLIDAASSDGIRIGWAESPKEFAGKCLVQEWRDRVSRYPNLTKLAQKLLGLSQTGVCDAAMTEKIKEYQKKCGLVADGGIGKGTWEFLLGIK